VPVFFIALTIVRELQQGVKSLADGGWESLGYRAWIDSVATRFGSSAAELEATVRGRIQEGATALLKGTVGVIGAAGGGILQGIVTIGAIYVGFYYGRSMTERIVAYSPLGDDRTKTLLNTVYEMVRASLYGVVAVAAAQGLLLGTGAWIAGLPAPVLWGFAAAMASVIPVVGSALVWVPGTIMLLAAGNTAMAIFFLVWCVALVTNIDNLIRPLIVMAALPVSAVLIFVAILGGIQAFGLIGILVGPVTLAVGLALLKMAAEEIRANGEEL
jgi:predicted PurR-regulated permease PerM